MGMLSFNCDSITDCSFSTNAAECFINSVSRCVSVNPGRILLTVILYWPISLASVFAHAATASRMVFDTPRLANGVFTEVEMILMILRHPAYREPPFWQGFDY